MADFGFNGPRPVETGILKIVQLLAPFGVNKNQQAIPYSTCAYKNGRCIRVATDALQVASTVKSFGTYARSCLNMRYMNAPT